MAGRKSLGHQDPQATHKTKGIDPGAHGRAVEGGVPDPTHPGRGSSIQGPKQDAKGGHQGANQGGANRGGSRNEPSHAEDKLNKDRRGRQND